MPTIQDDTAQATTLSYAVGRCMPELKKLIAKVTSHYGAPKVPPAKGRCLFNKQKVPRSYSGAEKSAPSSTELGMTAELLSTASSRCTVVLESTSGSL